MANVDKIMYNIDLDFLAIMNLISFFGRKLYLTFITDEMAALFMNLSMMVHSKFYFSFMYMW